MAERRFQREDLKPDEVLCDLCSAKCCRYFALAIDSPTDRQDFDHLRWYMIHRRISLFVEDRTWYLMVHADCEHLMEDNRCGIYEDRPIICGAYTTEECEFDDDTCYDQFFETAEQIREYAEAVLPPQKRRNKKAPIELPVLSS